MASGFAFCLGWITEYKHLTFCIRKLFFRTAQTVRIVIFLLQLKWKQISLVDHNILLYIFCIISSLSSTVKGEKLDSSPVFMFWGLPSWVLAERESTFSICWLLSVYCQLGQSTRLMGEYISTIWPQALRVLHKHTRYHPKLIFCFFFSKSSPILYAGHFLFAAFSLLSGPSFISIIIFDHFIFIP